jgi:hypothetical protein
MEVPGRPRRRRQSALDAAVRDTAEESGVLLRVPGVLGVFADPAHVVVSAAGEVRRQFVACLNAWAGRAGPAPTCTRRSTPGGSGVDSLPTVGCAHAVGSVASRSMVHP